jgi:circadian clock protein KaiC
METRSRSAEWRRPRDRVGRPGLFPLADPANPPAASALVTVSARSEHSPVTQPERASTGIDGLDAVLGGGLPRDRLYLIDGEPGSGKTTLALQFLLAGRDAGERCLYVTLSETIDELRAAADSHGWTLDGLDIVELSATQAQAAEDDYTLFHPAEVELQQTIGVVLEAAEQHTPSRMVFDSLSELRMLARDPLRFRRQILALKQFFVGRGCTVLVLDDRTAPEGDLQLQSIAHGVIALEHMPMEYGAERRRIHVRKLRGTRFRGGFHDFRIATGGLEVFPRLKQGATVLQEQDCAQVLVSRSAELDLLLGGGLPCGTSALITGAAGTGKSVLCMQYARAAVTAGQRARIYMFDERIATARARAHGLGIDDEAALADGRLTLRQIEPTEKSPGEFAADVVRAVDEDGVQLIVIDSLNGYMQAMPNERMLTVQVHELLTFLNSRGVTMIMTLVQRGIFGSPIDEAVDVSYLADTVILLRYFEFGGRVRQAMSVVKKRTGTHERSVREYRMGPGGLRVGAPLTEFRGVLTGVPEFVGGEATLMGASALHDR